MKAIVAAELAKMVKDGDVIGVGTGTTVDAALTAIGERVRNEGLRLTVVASSIHSEWRCHDLGFTVMYQGYRGNISWGFDGADEVDDRCFLIKGKGGALLQEKILAARCERFYVIVDESKVVKTLGANCAIPVEVIPSAEFLAHRDLLALGAKEVVVRPCTGGKHGPIITEAGNIILDAHFPEIHDGLEGEIKKVLGVVESGLFSARYVHEVLVGNATGIRKMTPKK